METRSDGSCSRQAVHAARGRRTVVVAVGIGMVALSSCSQPEPGPWQEADFGRVRTLAVANTGGPAFSSIFANRSGIDFTNAVSEERRLANQLLTHGSGVAIGDVDGDGLADVYLGRTDGPNALYRSLGGMKFEDITEASGTALDGLDVTGVSLADVDGDGDLDLLVGARGQANVLMLNDGAGSFTDVTASSGLQGEAGTTTLALADIDGDGDLDLYETNYKRVKVGNVWPPQERGFDQIVRNRDGRYEIEEKFREFYRAYVEPEGIRLWQFGEPDVFYLNDGSGHFSPMDWTGGRFLKEDGEPLDSVPDEWGLTARFQDVNGDLRPDLYVSNDFESPDQFWINQGDGTFQSISPLALRNTSASSMAVDFSDVDRNGSLDFFVVDMAPRDPTLQRTQMPTIAPTISAPGEIAQRIQMNRNTLFMGDGAGGYVETASAAGVEASGWSWGTHFMDVDLDGFEDIIITTGHVWDVLDADTNQRLLNSTMTDEWDHVINNFPSLEIPNVAFRNRGDGTFEDVSALWGLDQGDDIAHGLASGDLDGDGDLDLIINRLGSPVSVFRNNSQASRITVTLRGEGGNTHGVGARIALLGGEVPQTKEISAGGLYLSSPEAIASFAAVGAGLEIEVAWPSGKVSRIPVEAGRLYEIHEDRTTERRPGGTEELVPPMFVAAELGHSHVENRFNDFERQPLLPHRLSQMGPGLTWEDVDRDGDPDLIIPSGAGGRLAVMRNDNGRFTRIDGPEAGAWDQTTVLPLPRAGGSLLIGQSIYEAANPEAALAVPGGVWSGLSSGRPSAPSAALPAATSVVGAMAAADLDGDGRLEVFVGTRAVPVAYPQPFPSRIFRTTPSGDLVIDSVASSAIAHAGLVSGAVFTDLDADGDPDLVLAEDWGLIRVFVNVGGRLSDVTADWGLNSLRGRWNGVNAGDFDGDGRMDLIVTSWGRNTRERPSADRPFKLYWGDFDGEGGLDMVGTRFDPLRGADIPTYDLARLTNALPYIRRQQTRTFREFAQADISQVLGPRAMANARIEEVTTLDHQVLLNRGGRFEARPLPAEAQLAPAFHAAVGDLNGDGNQDVLLSQNFYPNEVNLQRYGSGRGIVLQGDGSGGFQALSAAVSGVRVFGDQRGAALADFDGDGMLDVAISQNGAETILLRNTGLFGRGLRVRMEGSAGNPRAAGAVLRVVYADGSLGPAQEVHLGGGYWSVDGAVQVLGLGGDAVQVEVRWPGGAVERFAVPVGAAEITVSQGAGQ